MERNIPNKIYILSSLITLMSLIAYVMGLGEPKKTWTYEIKSITSSSSDPERMKVDLNIERISRGVYAVSGTILFNMDIVEGDSNNITIKTYRSAQGDGDYKVLPFSIPDGHFYKGMNSYYKNVLMESLNECSDMPYFEDEIQQPMEKKTYTLKSCQISQDGLPNHLQDGFYKVLFIATGDVDWSIDVIAEVTPYV